MRDSLLRLCWAAVLALGLSAAPAACTDPRARPAPPGIKIVVSPAARLLSPGVIPASILMYDQEGLDSLHVSLTSPATILNGDSLYLFPDTIQITQDVVWSILPQIPSGTKVTLAAKAWNAIGFSAADSVILTIQ